MGTRLVARLALVAAGAAALLFTVPGVAHASSVAVSPKSVAPGERITVRVVCKGAGNQSVKVFWGRDRDHTVETREINLHSGSGVAPFTIPRNTEPGPYVAGVYCPSSSQALTDRFNVAPHGAPQAGVGPIGEGAGPALVAGAGVLAAAVAGGFLLLRRRAGGPSW